MKHNAAGYCAALLAAGIAMSAGTASAVYAEASVVTELSAAQQKRFSSGNVQRSKPNFAVKKQSAGPKMGKQNFSQKKFSNQGGMPKSGKKIGNVNNPKFNPKVANPKFNPKVNPKLNPNLNPKFANPKFNPKLGPQKLGVGPGKLNPNFNPKLANPKFNPNFKPNFPIAKLPNNKFAPIWKSKQIWWAGGWKKFLPLTALGVVLIGSSYYYPDGYLALARPYCDGLTPDGCRLNWQYVGFDGGGGDWQCVQYCPRPGALPPPQTVALAAPPPPAQGRCEVEIFSEPNFASTGAPTGEDQPDLAQSGWGNQISSVQVKAGNWDFFSGEQFSGETMRLPPGNYPTLGPDWTKKISSFMCISPSS